MNTCNIEHGYFIVFKGETWYYSFKYVLLMCTSSR